MSSAREKAVARVVSALVGEDADTDWQRGFENLMSFVKFLADSDERTRKAALKPWRRTSALSKGGRPRTTKSDLDHVRTLDQIKQKHPRMRGKRISDAKVWEIIVKEFSSRRGHQVQLDKLCQQAKTFANRMSAARKLSRKG